MKLLTAFLAIATGAALGVTDAHASPAHSGAPNTASIAPAALWQAARPRRRPPAGFNPRGWTKLGEKWVQGRRDRDVFRVGRRAGAFTHLTLWVEEGDVEIYDIVVTFGNGERWSPNVRHRFRENSRSRPIDLPGRARRIRSIAVRYGNTDYRGRARVAFYGRDAGGPVGGPVGPSYEAPSWKSSGWTRLGVREVQGRRDRDVIRVGRHEGRFTKLTVVVSGGDMIMRDMVVTFGNGERWRPELRHTFRNGTRTRVIDLPGRARRIRSIDFRYGESGYGGSPRVEVWARDFGGGDGYAKPEPRPQWNPRGWTRLGTKWVQGRRDRDVIRVGRRGRWRALTVEVGGSDVEMWDMIVTFGNGERFSPRIRHRFNEGARTRVIDLPGTARRIRSIEFRYGNLPGGGRANVTVWAR